VFPAAGRATLGPVANPKTPGDLYFENYCALNGYLLTYEPATGAPTKPDYLVERGGDRALVEVKHFTTMRETEKIMASPTLTAWFGGRELYGTLQTAVRGAGEQLAPLASLRLPLVVALTNPLNSDVSFFGDDVVSALFGHVKLRVNLDAPGTFPFASGEDAAVLHRDADGNTLNRLPHLSAVITFGGLETFPQVNVYDLSGVFGFTGTPLPRTMFDADDAVWFGSTDDDRFGPLPPAP
jgi:hypothetical protein